MKTAIRCATGVLLLAGMCAGACRGLAPAAGPSMPSQGRNLSYAPEHIIAHACARIGAESVDVDEIRIVHPKVFGLDDSTAIVYGNYYVIDDDYPHIPQIYPLILRTNDRGKSWMQALDPMSERASDLVELRFVDGTHGWIAWKHDIEGPAFGMLCTFGGGYSWESSTFHIPTGLASLGEWSFSSPWKGECIVFPGYDDIPMPGDESRRVGCWKLRTEDGGRNWHIAEAIAQDDPALSAKRALPGPTWAPKSPRWSVEERNDAFIILHLDEEGERTTVLTLPRVPYRADR